MMNAKDVIKELGGPTKVSAALSCRPNVVGNWGIRDLIPWHWHDELLGLARNLGVNITRDQLKELAPSPKLAKKRRKP